MNKKQIYFFGVAILILFAVFVLTFWNINRNVPTNVSTATSTPAIIQVGVPTASTTVQSTSIRSYSYGVADCSLLATSTGISGDPIVTSSYSLYTDADPENVSRNTGISFCYPSYLNIGFPSSMAWPPLRITWTSGMSMDMDFPRSNITNASPISDLLSNCLAGAKDACIPPRNYQIVHAINQNGLDYYIFWSDWEGANGIFSSSTGPFVYVATPGNPTLFAPSPLGTFQFTSSMLRDLIIVLNTLTVSRSL